ncbi:hypothetical protein Tco_0420780 [Tanacetum coccineum]
MKEMLHQRMFETGSYKSLPEHIALYEALEASMKHPPSPSSDLDQSKRRRHDAGASGSSQPQASQSSTWKKSDTRDTPSSSSKQQFGPHAEQPVNDIPIQDSDTGYRIGKLGDSDVHTLEDPTLILEILSRRFFLRLNLPDHRSVLTGSGGSRTSRTTNNQAFTIKKGMSMSVQMSPVQDGKRLKVDDQRLDLADDLKEAQDHISSTITSHKTKITSLRYKISHEELKTTS